MKKYFFIFIATLLVFVSSMSLISLIPQNALVNTSKASAIYYTDHDLFYLLFPNNVYSKMDHYADAILLNIGYNLDAEHPLSSSLSADFYNPEAMGKDDAYYTTVFEGVKANESYARYWHGSLVFIRPLMLLFNAKQLYLLNAFILALLALLLITLFIKQKHYVLAAGYMIAIGITASYLVPFSFEYTSTFMIMLLFSIFIVLHEQWDKNKFLPFFFLIGMCTNFVDFLTTETITLTVPLLLLLCLLKEKNDLKDFKEGFSFSFKACFCWGIAYSLTWFSKWLIASLVLHQNVFLSAFSSIEERTVGQFFSNPLVQSFYALIRNIFLLFPMCLAETYKGATFILFLVLFVLFCFIYLYKKRKLRDKWFMGLLCLVSLIPYIRYIALGNHSYIHFFFTYRAQFVSVLSFVYLVCWSLDKHLLCKRAGFRKANRR